MSPLLDQLMKLEAEQEELMFSTCVRCEVWGPAVERSLAPNRKDSMATWSTLGGLKELSTDHCLCGVGYLFHNHVGICWTMIWSSFLSSTLQELVVWKSFVRLVRAFFAQNNAWRVGFGRGRSAFEVPIQR